MSLLSVPVKRNSLKRELGVSAPAGAFLGITGIDSIFIEKTFLLITDVAGGSLGAVPPELVRPTGRVNLQEQAGTVRDPVPLRTLWQSANLLVG